MTNLLITSAIECQIKLHSDYAVVSYNYDRWQQFNLKLWREQNFSFSYDSVNSLIYNHKIEQKHISPFSSCLDFKQNSSTSHAPAIYRQ